MFHTRLFHDVFEPEATGTSLYPIPHTLFYVYRGSAIVAGKPVAQGEAAYFGDYAPVAAGPDGATVWRWELVNRVAPLGTVHADGVRSDLRMARDVKMFELVPTSKWLFRLDTIIGFQGTTGVHSHPGSGIRCLVEGHLRAESAKGEDCNNQEPGDVWYEEGAYPLVSTVDEGIKTTFLRGMILPPEYSGYADSATWISGQPDGGPKVDAHAVLASQVVTLQ